MINLLITAFGVVLVIGGFYAMSFGFPGPSAPPNFLYFFMGLCSSVLGAILVIFFGGRVNFEGMKLRSKEKKVSKKDKKAVKPIVKPKETKRPEVPKKIEPKLAKKPKEKSGVKTILSSKKPAESTGEKERKPIVPKKIEPKRVPSKTMKEEKTPEIGKRKPITAQKKETAAKISESSPKDKAEKKTSKFMGKKVEPVKPTSKTEEEFVKNRLNKLKENYIKNAHDIENLIEERLDSFKGTLDQIKSESKDPSIIWSFDAGDVQETMKETILKANKRILMMYPWVRNIDVGVLKRFMETKSKMIIQEASLDDDASVELIKLLMDNNVEIRTMPNVHTVAIVSDEDNGLIISTDPIYESFEVGVVYKDQKSIEEIERMFGEAWNLSKDIDLEIKEE
ncbi:MAG: hypothetical protein HZC47_11490 [Methanobacterium sp.]|uniref:hypothetical protein n=1 Tax=Methanobacterium sp. TaxID=2164 RepID=UPI003D64B29F|nr:hypothetical protein [Methanobacterium sp.]